MDKNLTPEQLHLNKGPEIIIIVVVFWCVAATAVGLRFLSRRLARAGYWMDDWMALASLAALTTTDGLQITGKPSLDSRQCSS